MTVVTPPCFIVSTAIAFTVLHSAVKKRPYNLAF